MRRRNAYLLSLLVAAALAGGAAWLYAAFVPRAEVSQPRVITAQLDLPGTSASNRASIPIARAAMNVTTSDRGTPRKLVVPEGLTTAQVLKLVEDAEGLSGAITVSPQEGALLADTYQYAPGDTRDSVVERMKKAMDKTVAELWKKRPENFALRTPANVVVLASIVAKESGNSKDRRMVASVLLNRIAKDMKLESDVTVSYGIAREEKLPENVLKRPLTRADLQRATPFNTYVNPGLPPTPICNIGRESLEAALHPAKSTYLFFSASGSSGNVFAHTADEHNRNVEQLRERTNAKASSSPSDDENEAMVPDGEADTPKPTR